MAQEHQQEYSYRFQDSPLWHQPRDRSREMLFRALDAIEEPVIIVDRDTRVVYVNSSYLRTFSANLSAAGVRPEEITSYKLTEMKDQTDVLPILDVLERQRPKLKYYSLCGDVLTTFSDIIPLKLEEDELLGAVILSRDTAQIAQMNHEMNRYRTLADELRRELDAKTQLPLPFRSVIGSSRAFVAVLRTAAQVARSNAAVCLTGESGTGKEVLAKAIHYSSPYAGGPLIKVNCAAIPETLLESELFGYEKGAFTGAKATGNPGKFELANGGTLFLDEIGEMPMSMQVKLLRALQEHEITRVGATRTIKLDFRLITATNRDLEAMVEEGTFREDLYYRISVIPLNLPPLRERRSDIPVLANHFLQELQEQYGGDRSFSSAGTELLCDYTWPGNIRELKNCVERMSVLSTDEIISTEVLPHQVADCRNRRSKKNAENYRLQDILEKTERDTIQAVLSLTGGNKARAIEILGISKRNFYMKLDKYNLR